MNVLSPTKPSDLQTLFRPKIWTTGDWNAFFGYGSNLLVNVLTLTGLLKFGLGMPSEFIFTRVLPAVGVMLFLSTAYYSWLAYQLAKRTGRDDVCALPSGPGVSHIFIVVLIVMLPIKLQTGSYIEAWEAGLAWVFIQSVIVFSCGFLGKWIRRITPRAALLAVLSGVAITFISIRPMAEMFVTPVIGLTSFCVILMGWFGGVKLLQKIPAGLVIIGLGGLIAWGSNLVGLNYGGLTLGGLSQSVTHFGFSIPIPAFGHVFSGFDYLGLLLVTAIPFGINDVVEAIDNVESAASGGDEFPTTRVLCADGIISMVGCLLGNPFMLVVYIGHPGWKAMGGRIGYCAASGLMILALCLLGIVPVILAAIPIVAVYPILLFIGMLIGSQAFQETPKSHAPAVLLGMMPHLAHWGAGLITNTLAATGASEVTPELAARLSEKGVLLHSLEVLGNGSVMTSIVLAATVVFVIERQFRSAAAFTVVGAVCTWFGVMHSHGIGIAQSPTLTLSYLIVAGMLLTCDRLAKNTLEEEKTHHPPPAASVESLASE